MTRKGLCQLPVPSVLDRSLMVMICTSNAKILMLLPMRGKRSVTAVVIQSRS